MDLTKREKTGLYVFGAIILILISYMYFSGRSKGEITVNTSAPEEKVSTSPSIEATSTEVRAYICGAVCKPGVYTLLEGDRIDRLLEMAGGATEEADLSAINLAERLKDEQYIKVPAKGEENSSSIAVVTATTSSAGASTLININTAGAEELDKLPGIGPALAAKIITYREQNGKFTSVEDIKNVSGIGDSKYENMKDYMCVK